MELATPKGVASSHSEVFRSARTSRSRQDKVYRSSPKRMGKSGEGLPSDSMELSHKILGSGPVAIVIHGITESRESFRPILAVLGEHYAFLKIHQ